MTTLIATLKATGKSLDSMQDLLSEELNDLWSAENQIIENMPKMVDAASSPTLKAAFQRHLEQTKVQKDRLEQVFSMMGCKPKHQTCAGIKGLIEEGAIIIKTKGDPQVKDAALIAAAQRIEHYEMAAYGAARTFAQQMGRNDVAAILQQTLNEEGQTDKTLTDVALGGINQQAARK